MQSLKLAINRIIFQSRWLQMPLYIGLILVLVAYAYRFLLSLVHLIQNVNGFDDSQIMLAVLDLIDVVMIANLLIMVIMAGYQTFVADLNIKNSPDHPEWLDEVDAGTMKIKLALALVGISSIHLLRTFIDPVAQIASNAILWQVLIHMTLVFSAVAIAFTNWIMDRK
jgi:uncharacterized protein (TIGR00645 family)